MVDFRWEGKYLEVARNLYVRFIRPRFATELGRQRMKLIWFVWGYAGLLGIRGLAPGQRLRMLRRFLRIDWNVPHSHCPSEITSIVRVLAGRRAGAGEGMVEAGCYQGGSTAKFSIACKLFGYRLWVYDSFRGVPPLSEEEKRESYDFSGQYAATQELVERNVARFGEHDVCTFYSGWFQDTLAHGNLAGPVRLAYIDCDVARGTEEALTGIVPALSSDGVIFSQDYHIAPVRSLLTGAALWNRLRAPMPEIQCLVDPKLVRLTFSSGAASAK